MCQGKSVNGQLMGYDLSKDPPTLEDEKGSEIESLER